MNKRDTKQIKSLISLLRSDKIQSNYSISNIHRSTKLFDIQCKSCNKSKTLSFKKANCDGISCGTTSCIKERRSQTNISKFAIDKDGREHGKMDDGQAKGISPEKAAHQILKGLKKDKREIPVGGNELIMLKLKRFFPAIHSRLIRKLNPM